MESHFLEYGMLAVALVLMCVGLCVTTNSSFACTNGDDFLVNVSWSHSDNETICFNVSTSCAGGVRLVLMCQYFIISSFSTFHFSVGLVLDSTINMMARMQWILVIFMLLYSMMMEMFVLFFFFIFHFSFENFNIFYQVFDG
jgi:hypothetical protein